jgi:predicted RNA-binding protein Jag
MLEELFQTLGFIYDIENRYYEGRSILSQDSNATTTLIGQDRKALRRLYP